MALGEPFVVGVTDPSAAAEARRRATALAATLGFDEADVGRVAIVVTEAATNLVKHAGGGEILGRAARERGRAPRWRSWRSIAGPGIGSLDAALRDGYSSAGSARHGSGRHPPRLVRVRRLLDAGRRHGHPRRAAGALAPRTAPAPGAARRRPVGAEAGRGACAATPGRARATPRGRGDPRGRRARPRAGRRRGRPRGPAASSRRIGRRAARPRRSIASIAGFAPTRGAAAAIAHVDPRRELVTYAGVGNIAGFVLGGERPRALVSHNGILGHEVRRIQEFTYPWPPAPRSSCTATG